MKRGPHKATQGLARCKEIPVGAMMLDANLSGLLRSP